MLLREVLGVVGTIEILAVDAALAAGHVAADDEVSASKVLTDNHVLDGLTWPGHVHGVGQVGPKHPFILRLLLQNLVSLVAHVAGDVTGLGRATGRVHLYRNDEERDASVVSID